MPRGVVLPASEAQLLSSADRACMRSFAAALPSARLEFAEGGAGRVLAMLTLAEGRFLFERSGRGIRVRDVRDRQFLVEARTVERVLAAFQDCLRGRVPGEVVPFGPDATPPSDRSSPPSDGASIDGSPDTGRRILVVEDQPYSAMEMEEMLGRAGYRPVLVRDGAAVPAAMATFREPVLAAMVSLQLKGEPGGREVIRLLREQIPNLPVVVVTGHLPLTPQADLRGLGGPTVRLIKPIEADRLLLRLAEVIASSSVAG